MCYNTLARANEIMKNDEEKRKTINLFMDEEIDYFGEVEVVHYLTFLQDQIGWDAIREKVKQPLTNLSLGTYYGCTLHRPDEVGIEPKGSYELMSNLFEAIGAKVVPFNAADQCCGSYQVIETIGGATNAAANVLNNATASGVEMLATSCPLCEYNLGHQQETLIEAEKLTGKVPVIYFTQLLAVALGLPDAVCHFELNDGAAIALMQEKEYLAVS